MKHVLAALALSASFSALATPVSLSCIGGSLNAQLSSDEIMLQTELTIGEEDSVIIVNDAAGMRVVSETEITALDDGKSIIVIGQNIDPEGENAPGLNIVTGKFDFSAAEGVVLRELTQIGDLGVINFTKVDLENGRFLKCVSAN